MKEENSSIIYTNCQKTIYIGGYSVVKAYTTFDLIRIFHAKNKGFEIQAHDDLEILLVMNGNMKLETEGNTYNMFAMDVAVVNSNKYHILESSQYSEVIVLQVKKEFVTRYFSNEAILFENFYTKKENFRLTTALINLLLSNYREPESHDVLQSVLVNILNELRIKESVIQKSDNSDLETREIVLAIVEELSYDISISLESFSNKYHISYSHLSREFLSVVGLHFTEYVRRIKLNYAVHRLINTRMSLTEVAIASGFSNSQVFSRIFKEHFNLTPSMFRKKYSNVDFKELPTELIEELEDKLLNLRIVNNNQINETKGYSLDLEGLPFNKLKKSWGKIVDLNQLIHGNFYISEFIQSLEKFNPDYLRLDFILKDGVYWPVFDSLSESHLIKSSFNELMNVMNRLGINLMLRIRVNKKDHDYHTSLFQHSEAINKLLNYASLKLGLVHLQHWAFELYVEEFDVDKDFSWLYDFSTTMVKEVQNKLLTDNLEWGINLGTYEDFAYYGKIVKLLDSSFSDTQPTFLSLEYILDGELMDSNDLNHLSSKIELSNLLSELSYEYLIDFTYRFDHSQIPSNPIKEAAYCVKILKGMLELKVDFQLISWSVEDKTGKRMGSFFNDKGIETLSYYFSFLMSQLFTNIRYVEPGLIISTDYDDNYNVLLLSNACEKVDQISLRDVSNKNKKELKLEFKNLNGQYKIVESRIPILTFFHYHSWLTFLDPDALSSQEKQYIRNKITPELRVSVEKITETYSKVVEFNNLDLMLIEMKKV